MRNVAEEAQARFRFGDEALRQAVRARPWLVGAVERTLISAGAATGSRDFFCLLPWWRGRRLGGGSDKENDMAA